MSHESPAIRQLRQDLAELRDPGGPGPGHELYLSLRKGILEELALLGAAVEPPAPHPAPIRLTTRPKPAMPPLAERVEAAPNPEVLPAVPVENPMPLPVDPAEQLACLMARLKATKKEGSRSSLRFEIRGHCRRNGLAVPEEAAKKPLGGPKASQKAPGVPKSKVEARPEHPEECPGCVTCNPEGKTFTQRMVEGMTGLKIDFSRVLGMRPTPAERIRALRSQALEILPSLEDLDAEAAHAANEEMDLLAKTLVLGGHLIARRTA